MEASPLLDQPSVDESKLSLRITSFESLFAAVVTTGAGVPPKGRDVIIPASNF